VNQKNAALALTTQEWVLSLDADETLSPELQIAIVDLFSGTGPSADGYEFHRRGWNMGRWISGCGWYPDEKLRLFRKAATEWQGHDVHEKAVVDGRVARIKKDILHYPYRSFSQQLTKTQRYAELGAKALFESGKRQAALRMVFSPPLRFFKAWVARGGFRDGWAGFVLSCILAYGEFLRYACLWEMRRSAREESE
jgi:glycosyltransferase involved in cell wall biosynthesis